MVPRSVRGREDAQAFRASILGEAHAGGAEAGDDAGLVESIGGKVVTVTGDPRNLKVTNRHDIAIALTLIGLSP